MNNENKKKSFCVTRKHMCIDGTVLVEQMSLGGLKD